MTLPERSDLITIREEALAYYANRVAGRRVVQCHGKPVTVVFEAEGTHFFSESTEAGEVLDARERIQRRVPGGRIEVRRFNLDRAHLMDRIVPAIEQFTVSIPGTGRTGNAMRMLHGPALPDGRYLRVVLRPGGEGSWTAVTAYPVELAVWRAAVAAKRAKFPP